MFVNFYVLCIVAFKIVVKSLWIKFGHAVFQSTSNASNSLSSEYHWNMDQFVAFPVMYIYYHKTISKHGYSPKLVLICPAIIQLSSMLSHVLISFNSVCSNSSVFVQHPSYQNTAYLYCICSGLCQARHISFIVC